MKKILFLLLITVASYGQTYPVNPTKFGKISLNTNGVSTSTTKINTQESDGQINYIDAVNLPVPTSVINAIKQKADLSTGLLKNGLISINADPTKFNISAGIGIISNFTNPEIPVSTIINFPAFTAVTPTYLTTGNITYIAINSTPSVVMQASPFTPEQRRDLIVLGAVVHSNLTNINVVNNISAPSNAVGNQLHDFIEAVGALNLTGNKYSANGANLALNKSAGTIFKFGVNFANDWKNPHEISQLSETALTFRYRTQNGTEGTDRINLNPALYDLNNVLTSVPNNKFTIQTVTMFQTGLTRIQYGQNVYDDIQSAQAAIFTRDYNVESNIKENGVTRAYIILKNNTTSLLNASDSKIVEAQKFGGIASGGVALTFANVVSALGYTPANDSDVLHKTLDETKIGNLSVIGRFNVSTGTSFTNTISSLGSGNVYFLNDQEGFNTPVLVGKSSNSIGLSLMSSTPDDNMTDDMRFSVRSLLGTDFTDNTKSAFNFVRGGANSLLKILRNGNSTLNGSFSVVTDLSQLMLKTATNPNKQLQLGYDQSGNYGYIQSIETTVNYRNLSLNPDGGNVLIGQTSDNLTDKLQVNGSVYATIFKGSAILTGAPTAPTAAPGTNTTQVATTAFGFANFLASSGNQTFTGVKSATNTGNSVTNGFTLTNSGTTGSRVINGISNGSGDFMRVDISSSSRAVFINNSSSNSAISVANISGTSGVAFSADSEPTATGDLYQGKNNGTLVYKVKKTGEVTAPPATVDTELATLGQVKAIRPYKVYSALVNQTGTSAPTVTVLENTLGGTPVFSYVAPGFYFVTLSGAFPATKTHLSITPSSTTGNYAILRNTDDVIVIRTQDNGTMPFTDADGKLFNNSIEIRVYN